jgi:hypothetical protein
MRDGSLMVGEFLRENRTRQTGMVFSQVTILILSVFVSVMISSQNAGASVVWETDLEISTDGDIEIQMDAEIAVEGDNVHVVWSDTDDGDWDIYCRHRFGTDWTLEYELSKDSFNEDQRWPSIAAFGGLVHVVWVDWGDGDQDIYYRRYNGFNWESEIEISTDVGVEDQTMPNVAVDGDEVHVVWEDFEDGDSDIFYRHFNGTDWQPELEISSDIATEYQYSAAVAVAGNKVHVAWADLADGDFDLWYRYFDGSDWQTEEEISIDQGTEDQFRPQLVAIGDEVFAVWGDAIPGDTDIYYRHHNGTDWEQQTEIASDSPGVHQVNVSIATDGFEAHLVWDDDEDGDRDILHRSYNGTDWGPIEEISTDVGSARDIDPKVAFAGGNVHVVWTSERDGDWDIIYRTGETDTQPPVSRADQIAQYWGSDTAFSIPWVATDNSELNKIDLHYRYSADHTSWSGWALLDSDNTISGTSASGTFQVSASSGEGYYEFYTVAEDMTGNTEPTPTEADMCLGLDLSPPSGSIVVNGGTGVTTSDSVTLTLTYSDNLSGVSGVRYRYDETWDDEPWEIPFQTKSWTLMGGEGMNYVWYQIKDKAGWISPTYGGLIELDTTAPTIDILKSSGGLDGVEVVSDIILAFDEEMNRTATENAFSLILDGEEVEGTFSWNADGKNLTFDPLDDLKAGATYRVFVSASAKDVAGNSLGAPIDVTFTPEKDEVPDDPSGAWTILLIILIIVIGVVAVLATTWLRRRGEGSIPEEDEPATEVEKE